jgi:uncharacterized protein YfkK (UPF0435 family)
MSYNKIRVINEKDVYPFNYTDIRMPVYGMIKKKKKLSEDYM